MKTDFFVIKGQAASPGIAIGRAYVLQARDLKVTEERTTQPAEERQRLERAIESARQDLIILRDRVKIEAGAEKAEIFDVQLSFLKDPEFIGQVFTLIDEERLTAVTALARVTREFTVILEESGDEILVARAADLCDVTRRLTDLLQQRRPGEAQPEAQTEPQVVIARDLTPSDTAQLKDRHVIGFVTAMGSMTSHSSILARAMGIPAVVGAAEVTTQISPASLVIVDGKKGEVLVNPSAETLAKYQQLQTQQVTQQQQAAKYATLPSLTADGQSLIIAANIGQLSELAAVQANGADEIGLFRSEFSYLHRNSLPTEEELYQNYAKLLSGFAPKPVIIRTLDIGGDKALPTLPERQEANPFLGVRAVRLCLQEKGLFRTQLRALLRASVHGHLKIMLPMIAVRSELQQAVALLREEQQALQHAGIQVSAGIKIGIMLEIPAALLMADHLAKEVDFFSIGTNDLVQYTMAADRMNEQLAYLQAGHHPAILRLIATAVTATRNAGKWIGVCGEMGGDILALPLLLGLGVDEISMTPSRIPLLRSCLSRIERRQAEVIAQRCLECDTAEEVEQLVKSSFPQLFNT